MQYPKFKELPDNLQRVLNNAADRIIGYADIGTTDDALKRMRAQAITELRRMHTRGVNEGASNPWAG